jgi:hypothetical protein
MRYGCFKIILAVFVFSGIFTATNSFADQQYGRLSAYMRTPTPYYLGNPKLILPKTNISSRTARNATVQTSERRAYPYGYFGAQTRPYSTKSAGYYGDYTQTSYGRGY